MIVYSPSSHNENASGFFFADSPNLPADAFAVNADDHAFAINLPRGASYSFTPPGDDEKTGKLSVREPDNEYILEQEKTQRLAKEEARYEKEVSRPILYKGKTFQADQASQTVIMSVLAASGGQLPADFTWYDRENTPVSMVFADLQGLANAIFLRGQILYKKKQSTKATVRNAKTIGELGKIT